MSRTRSQPLADVREVYDAHFGMLAGWANRLVGDRDLAHDFATEAMVRLCRDPRGVEEPKAWLYTVVANLVRDHWRKREREQAAHRRTMAGAQDVTSEVDQAQRITVREAVLGLPDRLRVAVLLHYYADLQVTVIARQLGKSEGAVKRDLFDARHRLAMILEDVR